MNAPRCERSGLEAADLARRAVEPSTLSLLGLVRHLLHERIDGRVGP
jgi:Protein of unknown function (DUF664)